MTDSTAALEAVRHALGPITGVVHAAGVLDDATIANLTDERVLRVLGPKVLGTALLTELTRTPRTSCCSRRRPDCSARPGRARTRRRTPFWTPGRTTSPARTAVR
ncbi:KR domain-containing protein [Streptomyces sp. MS1.AVA.1]|uniref:KR domain-containing protein n=1 Tax=Streptomyces machairae TaxID=3134109 RepID=A0ABU8UFW4_9ACTN